MTDHDYTIAQQATIDALRRERAELRQRVQEHDELRDAHISLIARCEDALLERGELKARLSEVERERDEAKSFASSWCKLARDNANALAAAEARVVAGDRRIRELETELEEMRRGRQ